MKSDQIYYLKKLQNKLPDEIANLKDAQDPRKIRDKLKPCCIEFFAVEHSRPESGLPEPLEKLVDKISKCCSSSGIELDFTIETSDEAKVIECRNTFLKLWDELASLGDLELLDEENKLS